MKSLLADLEKNKEPSGLEKILELKIHKAIKDMDDALKGNSSRGFEVDVGELDAENLIDYLGDKPEQIFSKKDYVPAIKKTLQDAVENKLNRGAK